MRILASLVLLAIGLTSTALLLAFAFGALEAVFDAVRTALTWIIGAIVAVLSSGFGIFLVAPNPLKQLVSHLIRLAPDVPNYLKKSAIKNEIEGSINGAFKKFNREGAGFVEHEIRISWLSPGEDAREAFFRSGKAYLKLDYSRTPEINITEAALRFCKLGLLRQTRQYVSGPLMKAIDLQFVDEILRRQRASGSRAYFLQDVMPREINGDSATARFVAKLQLVSQHGLFTRVLLPELRDYPSLALESWAPPRHWQAVEAYLNFVETTVRSREQGTKTALQHIGQAIRTAIVLVGIPTRLLFEGTRPYVRRIALNEQQGPLPFICSATTRA